MDIKDIPIVKVTWQDAQESDGSWTSVEEILTHECAICEDVGFLIVSDDTKLIIMRSMIIANGSLGEPYEQLEEGSSYIAIPKSWVINVQELAPIGATVSDC